jgi:fluoride ion exporter CrcB/FEX
MAMVQISPLSIRAGGVFGSQARNWLTDVLLASRKFAFLSTKSSLNLVGSQKICARLRPYATLLLTMIKIVLIAGISFASLSQ